MLIKLHKQDGSISERVVPQIACTHNQICVPSAGGITTYSKKPGGWMTDKGVWYSRIEIEV